MKRSQAGEIDRNVKGSPFTGEVLGKLPDDGTAAVLIPNFLIADFLEKVKPGDAVGESHQGAGGVAPRQTSGRSANPSYPSRQVDSLSIPRSSAPPPAPWTWERRPLTLYTTKGHNRGCVEGAFKTPTRSDIRDRE